MRASSFSLVCVLVAGCGGGGAATGSGPVTDVGQSVYGDGVTKLVLSSAGGGFAPPQPVGAVCTAGAFTYTLTVANHQLAWDTCAVTNDGASASDFTHNQGQRMLSDAEWSGLQPSLRGLVVAGNTGCGADKPAYTLVTTTSAGDYTYADSFYGCRQTDKTFVDTDALDQAASALGAQSHP